MDKGEWARMFHFPFLILRMRLDVYLKLSRLITRRSLAREFCDAGRVTVNGAVSKSSKEVKAGDEIAIRRANRLTKVRVVSVPSKKQVSKEESVTLFSVISDEALADI